MKQYRCRLSEINTDIGLLMAHREELSVRHLKGEKDLDAIRRAKARIIVLRDEAACINARFNIGDMIIDPAGFVMRVDSIQAESFYSNEPIFRGPHIPSTGIPGEQRRAGNSSVKVLSEDKQ